MRTTMPAELGELDSSLARHLDRLKARPASSGTSKTLRRSEMSLQGEDGWVVIESLQESLERKRPAEPPGLEPLPIGPDWWPNHRDRVIRHMADQEAAEEVVWWVEQQQAGGELAGDPKATELQRLRIVARALLRQGPVTPHRFPRSGPAARFAEYQAAVVEARSNRVQLDWAPSAVDAAKADAWAFRDWLQNGGHTPGAAWTLALREAGEVADALHHLAEDIDRATVRALLLQGAGVRRTMLVALGRGEPPWLPKEGRHENILAAWEVLIDRLGSRYETREATP